MTSAMQEQDGYLALRSQHPYFWNHGEDASYGLKLRKHEKDIGREVVAPGRQNIWICQLGRRAQDGIFEQFIKSICQADLEFKGLRVEYRSPGNGLLRFSWEEDLSVNDIGVQLDENPRYENPHVQADFNSTEIRVSSAEHELYIQWRSDERAGITLVNKDVL